MALTLAQFLENAGAVNHARDFRRMQDKLLGWDVRVPNAGLATTGLANGGVARYYGAGTTGDLAVTQRGAGANMSVDVAAGFAMVGGTESATQGEYGAYNDATVNVTISASDPTNPRIDVIGVRIRDTEYSGANNDAALIVVTGTPAGSPVVPTLPADFLSLAHVAVAALAASIVNGNITDKRRNLASLGGVAVCDASSSYPTVNLWGGQVLYDRALKSLVVYESAAATWQQIGPLVAWTTITPTVAQNGAVALSTAQGRLMRVGRLIMLQIRCIASGAGSGSNVIVVTATGAPAARATYASATDAVGDFVFDSAGTFYSGYANPTTPATPTFQGVSNGQTNYMGIAGPAAQIAASDAILVNAQYESAA